MIWAPVSATLFRNLLVSGVWHIVQWVRVTATALAGAWGGIYVTLASHVELLLSRRRRSTALLSTNKSLFNSRTKVWDGGAANKYWQISLSSPRLDVRQLARDNTFQKRWVGERKRERMLSKRQAKNGREWCFEDVLRDPLSDRASLLGTLAVSQQPPASYSLGSPTHVPARKLTTAAT